MRDLQERFGKPHPELIEHRPIPPQLVWLQSAFLRLHRRRRFSDMGGMQPLSHLEIADFAERTIQIPRNLMPFFSWAMEETDDAVMAVHHARHREKKAEEDGKKNRRR